MNATLKAGDRVRLKDSVSFWTVTAIVAGSPGAAASIVLVEWDGHEGVSHAVRYEEVYYVRPPPHGWPSYEGPRPYSGW